MPKIYHFLWLRLYLSYQNLNSIYSGSIWNNGGGNTKWTWILGNISITYLEHTKQNTPTRLAERQNRESLRRRVGFWNKQFDNSQNIAARRRTRTTIDNRQ